MLRQLLWFLRDLTGRRRFERDLDADVESYLEMAAEAHQRRGLSPAAARRAARLELGGAEQAREAARAERSSVFLETLWQDTRVAVRRMRRQPGFTLVAMLTLALGIGANATVFSAVRSVLLAPLPFEDSDALVRLLTRRVDTSGREQTVAVSPAFFNAVRAESQLLESIAAQRYRDVQVTGDDAPERIAGIAVSDRWAETIGVRPVAGRVFTDAESREGSASRVVLLGHGFWQRRFGGDPGAVGQTLRLNEEPFTVVGVMPAGFRYPYRADVWFPTTIEGDVLSPGDMNVVARMRDGATVDMVAAEIERIAAETSARHGVDLGLIARPMAVEFGRDPNRSIALLTGGVAFVLLLACVNLATLLLARSFDRQGEIALRAALGAGRRRQIRQLLTESVLLSGLGGAAGIALAYAAAGSLDVLIPNRLAEVIQVVRLDGMVLVSTVLLCGITGVLFGLAPALKLTRAPAEGALHSAPRAGRRRGRVLGILVASEVALATLLLVGAGMMVRHFVVLANADVGYDPSNLVRLTMSLSRPDFGDPARRTDIVTRVLDAVRAAPGVAAAGATMLQPVPRTTTNLSTGIVVPGLAGTSRAAPAGNLRHVLPGYFDAIDLPLRAGRDFAASDADGAEPVVIVSERAASTLWPDEPALDQRVGLSTTNVSSDQWYRVVGVVADQAEPSGDVLSTIYQPYAQGTARLAPGLWLTTSVSLLVRVTGDEAAALAGVRQAVWSVDAGIPLYDVADMPTVLGEPLADQRLGATMFASFGTFALLLAALGTYGVLAFSVSRRIPEFGLRLALGAGRADVLKGVLFEGLTLVGIGLVVGGVAAIGLSRLAGNAMSDLPAADPLAWVAAIVTLAVTGLVACAVPAWRATRVDPITALRAD